MSINQSQVDHIISSASADDPEVKLQNLQDEVDLLKKSVKRLLIDIRERMNELENPFILASAASAPTISQPTPVHSQPQDEEKPVQSKEPAADNIESTPSTPLMPERTETGIPGGHTHPYDITAYHRMMADEAMLKNLHQQIDHVQVASEKPPEEKLHLQKLHQLFGTLSEIHFISANKIGEQGADTYYEMRFDARPGVQGLGPATVTLHVISSPIKDGRRLSLYGMRINAGQPL